MCYEYKKASKVEFHKWKKSYYEELLHMFENCAKAQTNAREVNTNLRQLTNKMKSERDIKVKETREKLQRLDLLNTIVDIKKRFNGGKCYLFIF